MPSDCEAAQAHPDLPGINGTPRQLPGAAAARAVGAEADAFAANRQGHLLPATNAANAASTSAASTAAPPPASARPYPWAVDANVPSSQPAPPKEYATASASATERARFRGVRRVDTPLARESCAEAGGVLTQAGFPDAAPRRWDDQQFENRLKQQLSVDRPRPKPRAKAVTTGRRA